MHRHAAPSVRYALGEAFGLPTGTVTTGKMLTALKQLGFAHCWDTEFTADVTIWEEATEFVERLTHGKNLPHFTSCCPGWQKYAETFCPELLSHFSSCKSPIGMNGSLAKTYGAERMGYAPKQVYTVSIMPCIAKKYEGMRPELQLDGMREIDATLTTRELAYLIKEAGIDFRALPDEERDSLMGESSGAATIFGVTGGVMEAAIRTAYHMFTGRPAPKDFIPFEPVRGLQGVKKATVIFGHFVIHVAAISGLANARAFIDELIKEDAFEDYSFIEIMACPGGCIGGGGQPKVKMPQIKKVQEARTASLYQSDADTDVKASWQNPEIAELYEVFLDEPLSEMAEFTLHTYFSDKSDQLGRMKNLTPQTNPMSPKYKPPTAE